MDATPSKQTFPDGGHVADIKPLREAARLQPKLSAKRKRRAYTDKFKSETAAFVLQGGYTVKQVAKEFGLSESLLRSWMAKYPDGKAPPVKTPASKSPTVNKPVPRVQSTESENVSRRDKSVVAQRIVFANEQLAKTPYMSIADLRDMIAEKFESSLGQKDMLALRQKAVKAYEARTGTRGQFSYGRRKVDPATGQSLAEHPPRNRSDRPSATAAAVPKHRLVAVPNVPAPRAKVTTGRGSLGDQLAQAIRDELDAEEAFDHATAALNAAVKTLDEARARCTNLLEQVQKARA
jgi:transposase-like protein